MQNYRYVIAGSGKWNARAISYHYQSTLDLKYVRATNAYGSSWGTPVEADTTNVVGMYTSLAVVDGYPAISYYDFTNENLKYVSASDFTGSSWRTPLILDFAGSVGEYTSLCVVNGSPAVSYCDFTNYDLKFARMY